MRLSEEKNMREPQSDLVCYDPRRPLRYLEIRGMVVEMTRMAPWNISMAFRTVHRQETVFWRMRAW
jgi:hypothetical protein